MKLKILAVLALLIMPLAGIADSETVTIELPGGGTATGPMVDGERNGNWVEKYPDGSGMEGPYVDGKMNGLWMVKIAGKHVGLAGGFVIQEGPYVDGERNGNWWMKLPDGEVAEMFFRNGKQIWIAKRPAWRRLK